MQFKKFIFSLEYNPIRASRNEPQENKSNEGISVCYCINEASIGMSAIESALYWNTETVSMGSIEWCCKNICVLHILCLFNSLFGYILLNIKWIINHKFIWKSSFYSIYVSIYINCGFKLNRPTKIMLLSLRLKWNTYN